MPTLDLIARFIGVDAGAGREFEKFGAKAEESSMAWGKFAAAAIVGAGTVGAVSLEMADKFEEAHTRLESAVKNVGGNMEELGGAVASLDSRMEHLGFTNTDVQSGLAGLVTATKDPAKAIRDMGLAADLARGRNMSLADATTTLVKVETGHVSLLGRLGINTKNAAGETINQEQALQRLTDLYGGDASRYAGTYGGKVAKIRAEAEDLGIKIGSALIPILLKVGGVLESGATDLETVSHWMKNNKAAATILAGALGGLLAPSILKVVTNMKLLKGVTESEMLLSLRGQAAAATAAFTEAGGGLAGLGALATSSAARFTVAGALIGASYYETKKATSAADQAANDYVNSLKINVSSLSSLKGGLASVHNEMYRQLDAHNLAGFKALSPALVDISDKIKNFKADAGDAGSGTDKLDNGLSKTAKKAQSASTAVQTLTTRLDQLVGGPLAEHGEAQQWSTDLRKMAAAADHNTGKISDNTRSGLANAKMLTQQGNDLKDRIATWAQDGKSQDFIRTKTLALEKAMRAQADATMGNKVAVDRYLSSLNLTPAQINKVLHGLGALGTGMDNARHKAGADGQHTGQDYVDGVLLGLRDKAGALEASAAALGNRLNTAFRSREGISAQSPSKKGVQSGKDYGHGVANGVTASSKLVALSAHKMAQLLDEGLRDGWKGEAGKLKDALSSPIQNALDHLQTVIDNAISKQHEALKRATQSLKSDLASRAADIKSLKGTLAAGADLSSLFGTDATTGAPTMTNVGTYLSSQVGPLRKFAKDLQWADKHHLSPVLLSQIAGLGAVQGDQVLQQFRSGQASIADANRNEGLIQQYAGQASRTVEDRSYDHMLNRDRHQVDKQTHVLERIEHHMERMERHAARGVASQHFTFNANGKIRNLTPAEGREIIQVLRKLEKQGVRV